MKTSTLLLLLGGAGAGYYLYNKGRATAPAPAVTPTGPASIVDKASGVIQQIVDGLSSGAKSKVTVGYQTPPFNPQPPSTLSGTSLDGNVFSHGGLGSLGR